LEAEGGWENNERGFAPRVAKGRLKCEEKMIWRNKILDKTFTNINDEIDIRKIERCENKGQ
jgi:hypothetical protein